MQTYLHNVNVYVVLIVYSTRIVKEQGVAIREAAKKVVGPLRGGEGGKGRTT